MKSKKIKDLVIAIKGAGEMATGTACRLFNANFKYIFMMEIQNPVAVRRNVSFCETAYDGTTCVEGITAIKTSDTAEIQSAWNRHQIPVVVDPDWHTIKALRPHVVIDAIIAKKNLGTHRSEAPLVIGLGPGFEAGLDVHMAIETNRGHNLGRILTNGCPEPNTGIPGNIAGYTSERVLRAPCSGIFTSSLTIGTLVKKNDVIGQVDTQPVISRIDGVLRGLIRNHTQVTDQLKIGDIDPRGNIDYCSTVSEKSRAIGGSVLEAILSEYNR
ncbi:selenium-dependent molybdenum cofactor biosynthesis protein YqeB [Desulfobacula sp.]|uniref:selenium-dependent molybdenum cofactor biosynthesis protein YqeB n=1 Tax=Desulfobacula sp. TaxID=2593537 RepID=UPI00261EB7A6|nr:selenium-dependent molybdenum cofactor biosynthesis protein YqeB [Desulfobacula sp.]